MPHVIDQSPSEDEDCEHGDTVLDRPGANPVCYHCGEVNPAR